MKLAVAALLAMSACGPDRDIYVFASESALDIHVTECECEKAYYELPVGSCWDYRDCPCLFEAHCQPAHTVSGSTLRLSGCSAIVEVPLPTTFPTFSRDSGQLVAGGSAESIWVQQASDDFSPVCRQDRTYSVTLDRSDSARIEGPTVDHVTDIGVVHVTPIVVVEGASE